MLPPLILSTGAERGLDDQSAHDDAEEQTRALGKRRKKTLAKNGSTPGVVSTSKSWVAVAGVLVQVAGREDPPFPPVR